MKSYCVFVIAGSGPLTDELKADCHSDRVRFVGRLKDDELRWYHYAASVFAFPSITKNEAFGVALAESLAKKFAEAAHQRVAEIFTIPKMMEKMNEVYEEIMED